jgi:CDP-6-deoxy-D-xylo-4-hexulose-3-dehydrase
MTASNHRRIEYAGSVHDEREIEAVVAVLRGGPTALRIGRNVRAMEQRVASLFGKRHGVMCNSGSSALYLAVEVLDLEPGDEVITSPVTFSTDIAPMPRNGIVPAFVDVTEDTFQIDVDRIEEMVGPRTKAILAPNLIGNAPDWDRIREIADRHARRHQPDELRALAHHHRGGHGRHSGSCNSTSCRPISRDAGATSNGPPRMSHTGPSTSGCRVSRTASKRAGTCSR